MNAAYTLAYSEGNAEGPVNTDTDFGDTGRTEAFDDPWVKFTAATDICRTTAGTRSSSAVHTASERTGA